MVRDELKKLDNKVEAQKKKDMGVLNKEKIELNNKIEESIQDYKTNRELEVEKFKEEEFPKLEKKYQGNEKKLERKIKELEDDVKLKMDTIDEEVNKFKEETPCLVIK